MQQDDRQGIVAERGRLGQFVLNIALARIVGAKMRCRSAQFQACRGVLCVLRKQTFFFSHATGARNSTPACFYTLPIVIVHRFRSRATDECEWRRWFTFACSSMISGNAAQLPLTVPRRPICCSTMPGSTL